MRCLSPILYPCPVFSPSSLGPCSNPVSSLSCIFKLLFPGSYFPDKNHTLGIPILWHILSEVVKVLAALSCPTLCHPKDCSPAGSSIHGILQARYTGVGCHALLQGIFPTQGSPTRQADSLPCEPAEKGLLSRPKDTTCSPPFTPPRTVTPLRPSLNQDRWCLPNVSSSASASPHWGRLLFLMRTSVLLGFPT